MKKFMIKYKLFGMLSLMVLPLMLSCSSTDDGGFVAPIIKPEPPSPYTGEIGGEFELGELQDYQLTKIILVLD